MPLTVGDAFKTASGARGLVRSDQSARPMAHWRLVNPEFAVVLRDLLAHDGVPPSAIDTCLVSPMAYGGLATDCWPALEPLEIASHVSPHTKIGARGPRA